MKTINPANEALSWLREEYKIALGIWSETKALYPSDSPEVANATALVNHIEAELAQPQEPRVEYHVPELEPHE
jgi:hypothetical protein